MPATDAMTAEEFRTRGARLWGRTYQAVAARYWQVSGRSVRYWVAGERGIPPIVADELRALSPDDMGDDPPPLDIAGGYRRLAEAAVASGWSRGQFAGAMLALARADLVTEHGEQFVADMLSAVDAPSGAPPPS